MSASESKFSTLLTEAIQRIKIRESNKKIQVIQDELGYALAERADLRSSTGEVDTFPRIRRT